MSPVLCVGLAFLSYSPNVHGQICRDACAGLKMPKESVSAIIEVNRRQDMDEIKLDLTPGHAWFVANRNYKPEHHFDRNEGDSDEDAWKRGRDYFVQERAAAVAALANRDSKAALAALGRASHVLQDLYAHSNLIDSPVLLTGIDEAVESGEYLQSLRLTGYSKKTGRNIQGDDYAHDDHCKDGVLDTPFGKKAMGESAVKVDGRTKFDVAKELATRATTRLLVWVRDRAGADADLIFSGP